jgi:membrane protein YqaA with SNARE-associated domain
LAIVSQRAALRYPVRVHAVVRYLYLVLAHLGPWGLLILGVLDSSFLVMPLGNDLLLIGLTTQHPELLALYAPIAALGSVLGCALIDVVARNQGEEGLEKIAGKKRMSYLKKKIAERAAFSLVLAALAPPPFPFTVVVAAASAFEYPRKKMFTVIAASRLLRFTLVGLLAVYFGPRIIRIAEAPVFEGVVLGILALFVIGSIFSVRKWLRRSARG